MIIVKAIELGGQFVHQVRNVGVRVDDGDANVESGLGEALYFLILFLHNGICDDVEISVHLCLFSLDVLVVHVPMSSNRAPLFDDGKREFVRLFSRGILLLLIFIRFNIDDIRSNRLTDLSFLRNHRAILLIASLRDLVSALVNVGHVEVAD